MSGVVKWPERTFPLGEPIVTVGVEIAPESLTPTTVPLARICAPTKSLAFILPSTIAVPMLPSMLSVEFVSCPFDTVKRPKSCAWKRESSDMPANVAVQCAEPLSSI